MKRRLIFLLTLALVFLPLATFAAVEQNPANLLSGGGGGLVPQCEGAFCRACDLIELANNAINFGIAFSVIVATLMFAYAGILYVTAGGVGAEQVKKAHKVFINVFVGLIIVLVAWLFVNILFSVLTGKDINVWTKISCIANPTSSAFPDAPAVSPVTGGTIPMGTPVTTPGGTLSNAEAVRRLEAAGVCGGTTGTPCLSSASLNGVQSRTIDQAIIMHNACGCTFTITSGTDGRHSTSGPYNHGAGYKLDIQQSNNSALRSFVRSRSLTFIEHKSDWGGVPADIYHDKCGNVYAMEPTILDLQVTQVCQY